MTPETWDSVFQAVSIVAMAGLSLFIFYTVASGLRIWREPHIILLCGLLLRILFIIYQQAVPFLPFKRDPLTYDENGAALAHGVGFDVLQSASILWGGINDIGQVTHIATTAFFMSIFGAYPHVLPMVNSLLICLAFLLCTDMILRSSMSLELRRLAAILYALSVSFYPGAMIVSLFNLRDLIVAFAYILAVHALVTRAKLFTPQFAIGSLIFVWYRPSNIVFIVATMFVYSAVMARPERRAFIVGALLSVTAVGLAVLAAMKSVFARLLTLEFLSAVANHQMESGDRAYPIQISVSTIGGFATYILMKFYYFIYYPFPWNGFTMPATLADALYMLVVTPIFFYCMVIGYVQYRRGVIDASAAKLILFCLATALGCQFGLSIVTPTPGAAQRYKIPFILLMNTGLAVSLATAFVRSVPAPSSSMAPLLSAFRKVRSQ